MRPWRPEMGSTSKPMIVTLPFTLTTVETRGYLKLELDEKSGGYIIQSVTP